MFGSHGQQVYSSKNHPTLKDAPNNNQGNTMTKALIAALLALTAGTSQADYVLYSGNSWLVFCRNYENQEPVRDSRCEMLTRGLVQGAMYGHSGVTNEWPFCITPSQTVSQHIKVIRKFLDNHPEHLNLGAGAITILAMEKSFPCK